MVCIMTGKEAIEMALKILVAEDETRLNYLVCNYLKGAGYEVVGVTDGEAALDAFYTNYFSLVILDIMMPKMDGLEVCREIRKESNVPIVMLTARNTEFDELRGFETGADEYIAKPFSPKILVTRVNSVLKRAGLLQDNEIVLGKLKIHLREHNVYVEEKKIPLTPREYDLLNYLDTNKNLVLSREQILGAVRNMILMAMRVQWIRILNVYAPNLGSVGIILRRSENMVTSWKYRKMRQPVRSR